MVEHPWNLSPAQAVALQVELARTTDRTGGPETLEWVAGVDMSNNAHLGENVLHASVVVLSYPTLEVVEHQSVSMAVDFPYVPGLLSFREAPPILAAFEKLERRPELVIVDGQGYAHPRELGIASHLGLLLDLPTVGCAKSILVGAPAAPLAEEAGACVDLVWRNRTVGQVVRTRTKVQPVYVSAGHKTSLERAVEWVLRCARGYRLPEPTRQAHLYSNAVRRRASSKEPRPEGEAV